MLLVDVQGIFVLVATTLAALAEMFDSSAHMGLQFLRSPGLCSLVEDVMLTSDWISHRTSPFMNYYLLMMEGHFSRHALSRKYL